MNSICCSIISISSFIFFSKSAALLLRVRRDSTSALDSSLTSFLTFLTNAQKSVLYKDFLANAINLTSMGGQSKLELSFDIFGADDWTRTSTPLGNSFLDYRGYHYTTSAILDSYTHIR